MRQNEMVQNMSALLGVPTTSYQMIHWGSGLLLILGDLVQTATKLSILK